MPRGAWVRLGVFAAAFAIIAIVVLILGVPSVAEARVWVSDRGAVAPLVFVLIFAGLTIAPFPKSVLAVVGGGLWGLCTGLAICMVAVVLGASLSFYIGRRYIGSSVRSLVGPHMREVDDAVRSSFLAVLAIRVMPVLPFTLLNYAFGVTAIRYRRFALVTAIGSMPGTAAYVAVGATGADITSWKFWAALVAIAVISLAGAIITARRRRKRARAEL